MVSTMYIGGVETVDSRIMSFQVVTSGASVFTIWNITVDAGKSVIVDWGDGSRDTYTGSGTRTHAYAGAGTWTVRFSYPTAILDLDIRDAKARITFSEVAKLTSILGIHFSQCVMTGDSADLSLLRPTTFELFTLNAASVITLNSADVVNWRLVWLNLSTLGASVTGVWDSVDLAAWPLVYHGLISLPGLTGTYSSNDMTAWPITNSFFIVSMPVGFAVTLDSADIGSWRPLAFSATLSTISGVFNSSDLVNWRPHYFNLGQAAGMTGAFNSASLVNWPITIDFVIANMPAGFTSTWDSADIAAFDPVSFSFVTLPGFTGTFDSSDIASWRPAYFVLLDVATLTSVIPAGGFAGWTGVSTFWYAAMGLNQTKVDQILADHYTAFATRTVSGGELHVNGNVAPSGIYQAQCPPVTGKEHAYELVNDSCAINPTKKWTTVVTD